MEENKTLTPWDPHFPTGKQEFWMLVAMLVIALITANCVLYGGFNLGFAVGAVLFCGASVFYLHSRGHRASNYAAALIALNLIIACSFVRSDDGFIKFVMVCFLLVSGNLSLALMSGQNRRNPNGFKSLLDAPRAFFALGFGQFGNSMGGLNDARKNMGTAGKKNLSVLVGLAVAVPILAILIPLLMRADAAFEGLINLLPDFEITELIITLIVGVPLACILYSRNAALSHKPKEAPSTWQPKRFSHLTVNTALIMVCVVYFVYLLSQTAYFVGGFAGILPEEFTLAEYARRGFFEMAWISAINLILIILCVAMTQRKKRRVPLTTRIFCLFIGLVTLFLAATASAKMFLYIDSYGLTRLRVLTEVIMIFIALTVVFVAVWLFKPKFAYMKAVLLSTLIIGAVVSWADVDTVVAAYNVRAYQSGKLETVDISHLYGLGDGAIPYIVELTNDNDQNVAQKAADYLRIYAEKEDTDIRSYNISSALADDVLDDYFNRN